MFWNDPSLYGATLPYRELGTFPYKELGNVPIPFMGTSFNPWQNAPRFVPPVWGNVPFADFRFCDPRMLVQPWMQSPQVNPFIQPFPTPFAQAPQLTPFAQPFPTPFAQAPQLTPFAQPFPNPFTQVPYNVNLPLHNLYRPFFY